MKFSHAIALAITVVGLAVSGPVLADKDKSKKKKPKTPKASASVVYTSGAATLDHPGRLLASNCFQCHGTNGHGMESLAGESAAEISEELYEMKQKPASADIMNVHAQGYTTDQVNMIAEYFSKQQR